MPYQHKHFLLSLLSASILVACGGSDYDVRNNPDAQKKLIKQYQQNQTQNNSGGSASSATGTSGSASGNTVGIEAPVITAANAKSVSGTAKQGQTITVGVYDKNTGKIVKTKKTKADAFGKWSIPTAGTGWKHGDALEATASQGILESRESQPYALKTTIPVIGDVKLKTLNNKVLTGTAPAHSTVIIDEDNDGVPDHIFTVDDNGNWTRTLGEQADASKISVQLKDEAGNVSGALQPINLPLTRAPAVNVPTEGIEAPVITVANAQSVSGTAKQGQTITVGVYNKNTGKIENTQTVIADAFGKWSIPTASTGWNNGDALQATASDGPRQSDESKPFKLKTTIPVIGDVKLKTLNNKVLTGTAPAHSTVIIDEDNDGFPDHIFTADDNGNWTRTLGEHANASKISVQLKDEAGNISGALQSINLPAPISLTPGSTDIAPSGAQPKPVNIFLQDMAKIGQQTGPTVAAVDNNHNQHWDDKDDVRFNQVGVVSAVCEYQNCPSKPLERLLNDIREVVKQQAEESGKKKDELRQAEQSLKEAEKAVLDADSTGKAKAEAKRDAIKKTIPALKEASQLAEAQLKNTKDSLAYLTPDPDKMVIRDVNNYISHIYSSGTIDFKQLLASQGGGLYLVQQDAGLHKITKKRDGSSTVDYGGSIGKEFNGVLAFGQKRYPQNWRETTFFTNDHVQLAELADKATFTAKHSTLAAKPEYQKMLKNYASLHEQYIDDKNYHQPAPYFVDAYVRDPSAAGWSYQTFGVFSNKGIDTTRDTLVGYQSFGMPSQGGEIPKAGTATYNGIAHAYYGTDQVTSYNEIKVNFSDRTLAYKTLEDEANDKITLLHTFSGSDHTIEHKPDLGINGTATWQPSKNAFEGDVQTSSGLTGKIQGKFYGPKADEIGGVFGLTDANKAHHYVGGFGAKRP